MRQLAAILFVDMAGYTSHMQDDEQLARVKRSRMKDALENNIIEHNGKILQNYGDGALCIFSSAVSAVLFAIQVQQELRNEPVVDVRIGVHTGDVDLVEDAIYGDSVNLASRIESLATPGSIFISGKVFDEIKNQKQIATLELGYFELKNINQPVQLFAIANTGLVVPPRTKIIGKTKPPTDRMAVLPFVNMTADPENEFFSDGMTEEIVNALSQVEGLKVASRTSSFAFKGKNDDIREIGKQLNVDKILEGSVRKAGNKVRITAQLINATDGYHIWSENYDRSLSNIFELQDEISNLIADKMKKKSPVSSRTTPLKVAA